MVTMVIVVTEAGLLMFGNAIDDNPTSHFIKKQLKCKLIFNSTTSIMGEKNP